MPQSTEQTFRDNLSQFRWARGNNDDSGQDATAPTGSNPFARFYNAVGGGYIPLRSSERSNEEEAYFALSRWESVPLDAGSVPLGVLLKVARIWGMSSWGGPKFALAFSLGSLLVMFGFSVLIGPINHIKHLVTKERLPFSVAYLASLGLTLYFALGAHSYIGSLIGAIIQIVALASYVLAYFPGGTQTLRFGGQMALRGAGSLLPI
ncbi:Protein transport protein SFT2 [Grifola frondosa]|uniref:Protein transport protein SFT2 n=1 Tax=Grifola frondosa TaxID=5627 RepID=A0A1C7MES7_GRIFR|nr:Protein transport protein SFT2 [Grifola frondosa]